MHSSFGKLAMSVIAATLVAVALPVGAQTQPSEAPADQTGAAAPAAASPTKAELRKQRRAAHRAARKAARAKNTAELKRLEGAGYRPNADDPNYPQDLQDAIKKSGQ